jgi:cytochrome oxidase Cu insertion factor (SCO1/SenC/PrrC family)/ABC-type Zn2+ transport system substrate-binding protein/surface adhesin
MVSLAHTTRRGLLCLVLLLATGHAVAADIAPSVAVSIRPLHALVAGLMQGVGEPALLIAAGDPRRWQADEAARAQVREAQLIVWTGAELEPALAPLLAGTGERSYRVLGNASLKLLPDRRDGERYDPMFWLDSRNMLLLLDDLGRRLVQLDPDHRATYERNWRDLAADLGDLDRELEFGYRDVSGAPMFFYHDTHQYFEQAYAVHYGGAVAGILPGEDSAEALMTLRGALARRAGACLFTERALEESHLELLTSGLDVTVVELDSFGDTLATGPGLYRELMTRNFRRLAGCARVTGDVVEETSLTQPALLERLPVPDERRFPPQVTPRYLLADHMGRTRSNQDFAGRLQLVFFGFTTCPDICPTTISHLSRALQMLGERADEVQVLLITVDPQRDTPQVLGEYLGFFDPRILGLRGSPEVTRRTAELFRALYRYIPAADGDGYTVDHTASVYVLGRRGEFITKFAYGMSAEEMVERLQGYLEG